MDSSANEGSERYNIHFIRREGDQLLVTNTFKGNAPELERAIAHARSLWSTSSLALGAQGFRIVNHMGLTRFTSWVEPRALNCVKPKTVPRRPTTKDTAKLLL